jgi:hypothetical protein
MCNSDTRRQIQKAELQSILRDDCKHLSANHQMKLLQLLIKYELLFDGTLGDWKTKLVSFQIKEENTTPWPSFPSAKNTQYTLIKKVERLCKLGLLKQQQISIEESPSFIVPNKNKTICFLSNFGK